MHVCYSRLILYWYYTIKYITGIIYLTVISWIFGVLQHTFDLWSLSLSSLSLNPHKSNHNTRIKLHRLLHQQLWLELVIHPSIHPSIHPPTLVAVAPTILFCPLTLPPSLHAPLQQMDNDTIVCWMIWESSPTILTLISAMLFNSNIALKCRTYSL